MKKYFATFALLGFLVPAVTSATSAPRPTGFLDDIADIFSPEESSDLQLRLETYEHQTGNEIAVVTVDSLEGDTIEHYAVKLFEAYGIGKRDKDNGVLLLIVVNDRQMRIEVGYGLEPDLTDAESFHIINDILKPAFQEGQYYAGVSAALDRMEQVISGEVPPIKGLSDAKKFIGLGLGFSWYFFLPIVIFIASILGRSKSWWLGGVIGGVAGAVIGFLVLSLLTGIMAFGILGLLGLLFDYVVSKNYAKHKASGTRMPWWMGGGGPGGSSGSDSGGSSFSGFSGGSSGGGGASGGW